MTSDELRGLISKIPFSQRSAAHAIGMHERQFRHYCAGDAEIPRAVELALRYCLEHRNDSWIREYLRPESAKGG